MVNKNYIKGRRKEYAICDKLKKEGFDIAQRSAGSHSPIDVFAINKTTKTIKLIQAKPKDYNPTKIEEELSWLNNVFRVEFEVI